MNYCERCQRTFASFSTLRRHRRDIHRENLVNLPPGPRPNRTARIMTVDETRVARLATAWRDLRRRESQVFQRRLARATIHGENQSLQQLVEGMERVVADYLVGLPRPTPEPTFWYLGHLLDQADLNPYDVRVFPFGAQLQRLHRPPEVIPRSLRQRRGQRQRAINAVASAQQMLSQRPNLLRRFEFLFVAFCAHSAQHKYLFLCSVLNEPSQL